MAKSSIGSFVAKVKTDKQLREKILAAEKQAASAMIESHKANVDAIKAIAKEAGFDIDHELARPKAGLFPQESEIASSCGVIKDTCCYLETSCWKTSEDWM